MKLSQLMSTCLVKSNWSDIEGLEISRITQYIEEVSENTLFICINNTKYDGHLFIDQALSQGAAAIVVDYLPEGIESDLLLRVADTNKALAQIAAKFYDFPSRDMTFIGVTGTNGKTTTSYLINEVLTQSGERTGLVGTLYNKIDTSYLPTANTTPHTVQLQGLLAQMAAADISLCTMEVSSHGLKQDRVLGIDFNVAVFTNFTPEHLDFHPSMADYFSSKARLFSGLGNGFTDDVKAAVINVDDPSAAQLISLTPTNIYTYGCMGKGDIQAIDINLSETGAEFTLAVFDKQWSVSTQLIGLFNVYNCLAAFGACLAIGLEPEMIIRVLETITGVKGRFETVANELGITAVVDYAHTPDGLKNVLLAAKAVSKGAIYCVVGCGGDRDQSKRPLMGAMAVEYATHTIFTSDNPRTEDPLAIIGDMVVGLSDHNYQIETDRQLAIEKALGLAKVGDLVLVAGKGHETRQLIGDQVFYFDDRDVMTDYFEKHS